MALSSIIKLGLETLFLASLTLAVGVSLDLVPGGAFSGETRNMKIKIDVSGKTVTATLADNPTAKEFASLLPLTLPMKDLFGREKFARLPKALSEKGPRTNTYEIGDIAYWSPAQDVAFYYRKDSELIPAPGVILIAKIDEGADVFDVPGAVEVRIEVVQ